FCGITDGLCRHLIGGWGDGATPWQFDREFASRPDLACDVSLAPVREREVFDDGQSESGAAGFARTRLVHAVKALEDAGQVFGWDARPRVAHLYRLTIFGVYGEHCDGAAGVIEFDRVVHEVDQNLIEPPPVGVDVEIFGDLVVKRDTVFGRAMRKAVEDVADHLAQRQSLDRQADRARFDRRQF